MGLSSSTLANSESTDHFAEIVNPKKVQIPVPDVEDSGVGLSLASKGLVKNKIRSVRLDSRASLVKKLDCKCLWDNFIQGSFMSFALSQSDATSLIKKSLGQSGSSILLAEAAANAEIASYIELVEELSEKDFVKNSKMIDFMALCSSTMLLSADPIEFKIDWLYQWITMQQDAESFCFKQFFVALRSFERGLSQAMGKSSYAEESVRAVARDWFALADPNHRGVANEKCFITSSDFFDFCSNRQHVVRRLLEALSVSEAPHDNTRDIEEVIVKISEIDPAGLKASGGDEWMANPAWKKTAELMIPEGYSHINSKPTSHLKLEWVHGYRGFDCRNNLGYVGRNDGEIFFHAAGLGIVQRDLGIETSAHAHDNKQQHFFGEHSDDIISSAIHSKLEGHCRLLATGEIGLHPAVYLYEWNTTEKRFESLNSMRGFHSHGVCQICFAKDGKSLITIGVDYTVAVYDSDKLSPTFGKMTSSSQGPKDKVLHCASLSNGNFVSCGEKHAIYWGIKAGRISQIDIKLTEHKRKLIMCTAEVACSVGKCFALGTSEGDVILCNEDKVDAKRTCLKVHKSAINSMWSDHTGTILVTGGSDSNIIVWQVSVDDKTGAASLLTMNIFPSSGSFFSRRDLSSVATSCPPVRSASLSDDKKTCLIGTQSCEIIEYTLTNGEPFGQAGFSPSLISSKVLLLGHFKSELWGLGIRPVGKLDSKTGRDLHPEFCTVGDDGFLRIWDLFSHSQKNFLDMKAPARCCAYSPDGQYLAVGFGNSSASRNKHNGAVRIYRGDTLQQVCEMKEAKQCISSIKFSPDGNALAVGAKDNSIYIYSVTQQFKRKAKFSKHNAGIQNFDFTSDGKYMQSTCNAYEILFSNTSTGAQLSNGASFLADQKWATYTCTLGWPVLGVWSGSMDGTDVNSADRSPSGKLLATGDDFGKVNCYKYPCTLSGGSPKMYYSGHSSHVTAVRWINTSSASKAPTDDYLISLGGEDKTIMQWRVEGVERDVADESVLRDSPDVAEEHQDEIDAALGAHSGGDEFMAVKAWLGSIKAPSAWVTPDPAKKAPFYAAVGELGSRHRLLREIGDKEIITSSDSLSAEGSKKEKKSRFVEDRNLPSLLKTYSDVQSAATTVMNRMAVSGEEEASQPDGDELELEWVHGFASSFSNRNQVVYIKPLGTQKGGSTRHIVYAAAALGIVVCIDDEAGTKKQKYFRGHTDDITSLAIRESDSQILVASGQVGKCETFIWEVPSMKTLAILKTAQKNVTLLEFSKSDGGRLLVSIASDSSVCVSDWKNQVVLARVNDNSADGTYHISASVTGKGFEFFTCGNKFITLWRLDGRNLISNKVSAASVGKGVSALRFFCCSEVKQTMMFGCEDGKVYLCASDRGKPKLKTSFVATQPAIRPAKDSKSLGDDSRTPKSNHVLSMCVDDSRDLLLIGNQDGSISQFSTAYVTESVPPTFVRSFHVTSYIPDISAAQIHGLSVLGNRLVVCTRGADMLELEFPDDSSTVPCLVATKKDTQSGIITRGHCNNELWGLGVHPLLPEYCTVGDDMTLRTFSVTTKKSLSIVPLGALARACEYNNDGSLIAVGFGGRLGRGKEAKGGMVRLYRGNCHGTENDKGSFFKQNHFKCESADISTPLAQAQDAKLWISVVRFSADGQTLAVGSHDCKIYIYNVILEEDSSSLLATGLRVAKSASLTLRCTFRKHNSVINHIDLSANGRYMQSNCAAYELLFSDTSTGRQIANPNELKDVSWHSWTCTLGWPVQGIWASGMDGSDINSVARSSSGHLVATADDFGKIRIFRYPAVKEGAASLSYSGHSSHVTNVRWTAADECLISCGGNDKCVMQWKHIMSESSTGALDASRGVVLAAESDESAANIPTSVRTGGDESGAVKPWLGAVRTPKNPPLIDSSAPAVSVTLEWVHGYTSGVICNTRASQNLWYAADGNPVYPAAALGVKFVKSDASGQRAQQFFRGHNDDVLCLTVSSDRRFVATGQVANVSSHGNGSICVWDSRDCRELCRMDNCHQRAVTSLAFSPDGVQLLSIGQDNKNTHKLWTDVGGNWCRVQCTATAVSDQSTVYFSQWLKGNHASACQVVSGGVSSINFWKLEGSTLVKKQGRFGRKFKQAPLLCAANLQSADEKGGASRWCLIVGSASGSLFAFDDREVSFGADKAHDGPILCLAEGNAECTYIVSGGRDNTIRVWNQSLQPISVYNISNVCVYAAGISSLDIRPPIEGYDTQNNDLAILVGTVGGDIVELTLSPTKDSEVKSNLDISRAHENVLVSSHSAGELWGLAVHPSNPDLYVTVGDDASLRIWSIRKQRMIYFMALPRPARSVAWAVLPHDDSQGAAPGSELIAVGFSGLGAKVKSRSSAKDNVESADSKGSKPISLQLYSAQIIKGNYKLDLLSEGSPTTEWVSALHFSPLFIHDDGTGNCSASRMRLGAGCHDRNIYFYDLPSIDELMDSTSDEKASSHLYTGVLSSPSYLYKKHSSAIINFDFSLDGSTFQSNCQAGELLFGAFVQDGFDPDKYKVIQKTSATEMAQYNGMKDVDGDPNFWSQQTCTLGWPVQGIWPPGADTSDINSCDRSPKEDFLATVDDFGLLKIFRYPCVTEGSKYLKFSGHSSHVTSVRWTLGEYLITTGGNDKCIFVWRTENK